MKRLLLLLPFLLLTACSSGGDRPVIGFIGVATGTLATGLPQLHFQDQFTVTQRNIIAVVAFKHVKKGTTVQATWFSPDDRHMPLGRTSIVTESGATITRFSFASTKDWQPAPYMLQIDAMTQDGKTQLVGTGALQFFIGMKPAEVTAYQQDYQSWKAADAAERASWDRDQQAQQHILDTIQHTLGFSAISLVSKQDVTGDGHPDFIVDDAKDSPPPGSLPGVLATATVHQAAITDQSGSTLVSLRRKGAIRQVLSGGAVIVDSIPDSGDVQLSILPSLTVSLSWANGKQECFADLTPTASGYAVEKKGCR